MATESKSVAPPVASSVAPPPEFSLADRVALRAAALASVETKHRAVVEAARVQISAAEDARLLTLESIETGHTAAVESAVTAFQHRAAERFAPLVTRFMTEPARAISRDIRNAFVELDQECRRVTGVALEGQLAHAFGAAILVTQPAALGALANRESWHATALGSLEASVAAGHALRSGSDAELTSALVALEAAVARAAVAHNSVGSPERRWDIIRFGGSKPAINSALAAIDREEASARTAASVTAFIEKPRWRLVDALLGPKDGPELAVKSESD